jgi:prophage regulatory protein
MHPGMAPGYLKGAGMARILRLDPVLDKTGDTRSPHYSKIAAGLFTQPVKLGGVRAAGWPEHEVDAIVAARIAGASADQIRALVRRLHEQRKTAVAGLLLKA